MTDRFDRETKVARTFEDWWDEHTGTANSTHTNAQCARAAWEDRQAEVDRLQKVEKAARFLVEFAGSAHVHDSIGRTFEVASVGRGALDELRDALDPGGGQGRVGAGMTTEHSSRGSLVAEGHLPRGYGSAYDAGPSNPGPCGKDFMSCNDSTDERMHTCELPKNHAGDEHKCACGLWGDC